MISDRERSERFNRAVESATLHLKELELSYGVKVGIYLEDPDLPIQDFVYSPPLMPSPINRPKQFLFRACRYIMEVLSTQLVGD